MKVLLASPNFHQARGNTVTVQRISDGLKKLGIETEIINVKEGRKPSKMPQADIVHGFHAYRFGQFIDKLDTKPESYLVTMTGTDLNVDLFDKMKRSDVIRTLSEAKAIHVFDKEAKQILSSEIYGIQTKITVIPQGTVEFPETAPAFKKEQGTFLFVLPAGIRKVKNIPFAIEQLKHIYKNHKNIRLWLAGPIIEEDEGHMVKELAEKHKEWVRYLGQIPHEFMGEVYKQADAVLNTSHSEGQPAAILEAMQYSLPVLAFNNLGNRNIITHRNSGLIYTNPVEFLDYAEKLVNNNEMRIKIGRAAKFYVECNHSSECEAKTLQKIYESILVKSCTSPSSSIDK
ncbi:glycosyltransferase family 4 protein [Bacillus sp. ISL-47]|uniref:glycosyltransferase n=1 Tax=Bacillus sp. ISL-47 TaxID=2819130 RepID=UPI001BE4F490|nr:glycosyltransferase [Bacillus sp. ISL-47]MBT2689560.1 glycosyltransferase family 4 protein [Bacillus sp. ISL-47]MBT2708379.1 glycosyltransferase family 4 protein [Pseudomonas sp. ISL-84]